MQASKSCQNRNKFDKKAGPAAASIFNKAK